MSLLEDILYKLQHHFTDNQNEKLARMADCYNPTIYAAFDVYEEDEDEDEFIDTLNRILHTFPADFLVKDQILQYYMNGQLSTSNRDFLCNCNEDETFCNSLENSLSSEIRLEKLLELRNEWRLYISEKKKELLNVLEDIYINKRISMEQFDLMEYAIFTDNEPSLYSAFERYEVGLISYEQFCITIDQLSNIKYIEYREHERCFIHAKDSINMLSETYEIVEPELSYMLLLINNRDERIIDIFLEYNLYKDVHELFYSLTLLSLSWRDEHKYNVFINTLQTNMDNNIIPFKSGQALIEMIYTGNNKMIMLLSKEDDIKLQYNISVFWQMIAKILYENKGLTLPTEYSFRVSVFDLLFKKELINLSGFNYLLLLLQSNNEEYVLNNIFRNFEEVHQDAHILTSDIQTIALEWISRSEHTKLISFLFDLCHSNDIVMGELNILLLFVLQNNEKLLSSFNMYMNNNNWNIFWNIIQELLLIEYHNHCDIIMKSESVTLLLSNLQYHDFDEADMMNLIYLANSKDPILFACLEIIDINRIEESVSLLQDIASRWRTRDNDTKNMLLWLEKEDATICDNIQDYNLLQVIIYKYDEKNNNDILNSIRNHNIKEIKYYIKLYWMKKHQEYRIFARTLVENLFTCGKISMAGYEHLLQDILINENDILIPSVISQYEDIQDEDDLIDSIIRLSEGWKHHLLANKTIIGSLLLLINDWMVSEQISIKDAQLLEYRIYWQDNILISSYEKYINNSNNNEYYNEFINIIYIILNEKLNLNHLNLDTLEIKYLQYLYDTNDNDMHNNMDNDVYLKDLAKQLYLRYPIFKFLQWLCDKRAITMDEYLLLQDDIVSLLFDQNNNMDNNQIMEIQEFLKNDASNWWNWIESRLNILVNHIYNTDEYKNMLLSIINDNNIDIPTTDIIYINHLYDISDPILGAILTINETNEETLESIRILASNWRRKANNTIKNLLLLLYFLYEKEYFTKDQLDQLEYQVYIGHRGLITTFIDTYHNLKEDEKPDKKKFRQLMKVLLSFVSTIE